MAFAKVVSNMLGSYFFLQIELVESIVSATHPSLVIPQWQVELSKV